MEKTPSIQTTGQSTMGMTARRNQREVEDKKEQDHSSRQNQTPHPHQFMSSQSRAGVQMSAGSSDNSDNDILSDNTISNQSTGKLVNLTLYHISKYGPVLGYFCVKF